MRGFLIAGTVCFFLFLLFPYLPIGLVYATLFIGVAGLILFTFFKRPKQKNRAVACFFVFAASLIFLLNHYSVALPAERLSGKAQVVGTMLSGPQDSGGIYKYTLKIKTVNGKRVNGAVEVITQEGLSCTKGDIIKVSGEISNIKNEGFFNSKAYYYSKGIFLKLQTENDLGTVEGRDNLRAFFFNLSEKISSSLKGTVGGEEGALLAGIVANDKDALSPFTNETIRKAGYSHLINVSGLHLSIVASFFFLVLCELLRGKRKWSAAITAVMIFFYMALTAFSVSTIRAGIMLLIYFFGMIIERESDSKNSLGAAVTIILIINPYAATNPSFLLSTLSTAGIILSTDLIIRLKEERKISPKLAKALIFLCPSFSAVFFSAPASMMLFGEINLISPISNLAISLLITPVVILGLILAVLLLITGTNPLTGVIGLIVGVICKVILVVASFFARVPLCFEVNGVLLKLAVFLIVLLVFVLMLKLKRKGVIITALAALILASFSGSVFERREALKDSVWLLSGENYKSYVYIASGKASVFGADNYKGAMAVSGLLDSLGISAVEYFYLRSAAPANLGACNYIMDNHSVERVVVPKEGKGHEEYEDRLMLASSLKLKGFSFVSGSVIAVEQNSSLLVINLDDETKDFPFKVEITTATGKITRFYDDSLAETGERYYNDNEKILNEGVYRYKFRENGELKEVKTLVGYYG